MRSRREVLRRIGVGIAGPLLCRADAEDMDTGFAQRIFIKINEIRVLNGTGELAWSDAVAECAREQSIRKAELRFPGHDDPERGDVAQRLRAAGLEYSHCGENLFMERGWDDPVNYAVVCWWYSPGHQANLLKPDYTETGVGLAQAEDDSWFVTQIFRAPPAFRTPAPKSIKRFP
jgi:uncharacterized protein YkwD